MKKVDLKLINHSYSIYIGKNYFKKVSNIIENKNLPSNLFIVVDKNVYFFWKTYLQNCLSSYKGRKYFYILNAIESLKSLVGLKKLYSALLKNNFGKDTLMLSIGGGVTGDLTGFAASVYMRGIPIVHVPTTLLACVDSSIGGKTAVNFDYYKNIIGSFHQPEFVLIDTEFLNTLPVKELVSGLGELIKYAFISDKRFFEKVNESINPVLQKDIKVLMDMIFNSVRFKASVVSLDEREMSLRKILNFGHTFAHAFEKEFRNKIKHGEAVTAGIVCALYLSYRKKLLDRNKLEQFLKLPLKLKVSNIFSHVDVESIYGNMFADKKNLNRKLQFVLLQDIGEIALGVNCTKRDVLIAINNGINSLNFE